MKSVKIAVAILAVLSLLATADSRSATAKEIDLGWNVRNAANFMYAASQIDRNAEGKNAIPAILEPYELTYDRQWTERFKEGLLLEVPYADFYRRISDEKRVCRQGRLGLAGQPP
ncbi:MAG: hypothetical protein AAF942_08040 [Pseudomonadota bacterium]